MLNSHAVRAIKNRRSIIFHDTMYAKDASIAEAKEILMKKFGYTEQEIKNLAKDSDPRGYKVKDQIIKGFMIYKSGKPNTFTAKNESGEQYEGTMEEIKKQIDNYWVKQDEDVMKQKVNDEDSVIVSPETGGYDISVFIKNKKVKTAWKSNKTLALQTARDLADFYRDDNGQSLNIVTKDARPKHPRWRIKDDKLFKLKSAVKKMKDADLLNEQDKRLINEQLERIKKHCPINSKWYIYKSGKLAVAVTVIGYPKDLNGYGEDRVITNKGVFSTQKLIDPSFMPSFKERGGKVEDAEPNLLSQSMAKKMKDSDSQREILAKLAEKAGDIEYANDVRSGKVPYGQLAKRIAYYRLYSTGDAKNYMGERSFRTDDVMKQKDGLTSEDKRQIQESIRRLESKRKEAIKAGKENYLNSEIARLKKALEEPTDFFMRGISDSKTKDDIFYQGQQYPAKELHRILANKGKVKEFNELSEKEQKERMGNPFALYESGDNIYAVVRRNKAN